MALQIRDKLKCIFEDVPKILRQGARKMLQQAIENEVSDYIDRHPNLLD